MNLLKKIALLFCIILPNPIKIGFYRILGYKIGKNVKIRPLTIILADKANIGDGTYIGYANIFKLRNLEIGSKSIIRSLNMFIGEADLLLGKSVQIVGPFTFLNLTRDIILKDRVGLGSHSTFYTHGVYLPYSEGNPRKFGKIILEENTWSPASVTILPGVTIGKDSIIASGSVIHSSFLENSFIIGNPAKRISKASFLKKKVTPQFKKKVLDEILLEFQQDNFLFGKKQRIKKNRLIFKIKKEEKQIMYIQTSKDYTLLKNVKVIFGYNLQTKKIPKNVDFFDLSEKSKRVSNESGLHFQKHLEKFGELFI